MEYILYYKIIKNSGILLLGNILNKVIALVILLMLVRYLGSEGYGEYSLVLTLVSFFIILTEFGLNNYLIKEISKNKEDLDLYLSSSIFINVFFSIISLGILILLNFVINYSYSITISIYLASISLIFISLSSTFYSIWIALEKVYYVSLSMVSSALIQLVLLTLAIITRSSLPIIFLFLCLTHFLNVILIFIIHNLKISKIDLNLNLNFLKKVILSSTPFILINFFANIHYKIGIIMLSFFKFENVVGWYSASYNFIPIFMFISYSYCQSFFSSISKIEIFQKIKSLFVKATRDLAILSGIIIIFVLLFKNQIVLLVFGKEFLPAINSLTILVFGIFFIFLRSPALRVIFIKNGELTVSKMVAFTAILNIFLNIFLIPTLSYIGASISALICEFVLAIMFIFKARLILNERNFRMSKV